MIHQTRVSRFVRAASASIAAAFLSLAPVAHATDFTDIWFTPSESGWGVNIVQSDAFMFLTFFIYGPDKKPTWYTAQLTFNGTNTFTGPLYLTGGSYFAAPWNPAESPAAQQVGTASFRPTSATQGALTYSVDGAGTVNKTIERQALTRIGLGGTYIGGLAGTQSNCSNTSQNGSFQAAYQLQVSQTDANVATFFFDYTTFTCTLQGTLDQRGKLYSISNASYTCTQNGQQVFSATANMSEIAITGQGIEGGWVAGTGNGCIETSHFSAASR